MSRPRRRSKHIRPGGRTAGALHQYVSLLYSRGSSQVAVAVVGAGLVVVALLAVGDAPVLAGGVGRQLRVGAARAPDERVRARAQLHELLLDALRDGAPRLLLRRVRAL